MINMTQFTQKIIGIDIVYHLLLKATVILLLNLRLGYWIAFIFLVITLPTIYS